MELIQSILHKHPKSPPLSMPTSTIKTRLCIISDTHVCTPLPTSATKYPYRHPFPACDVLIHCGDISFTGYEREYETILNWMKNVEAKLKLVIPGNHDITLHETFYLKTGKNKHRGDGEDLGRCRELWCGKEARRCGVVYLEEGVRKFDLMNGATFTVYSSPWQPEFFDWAFTYPRHVDRFNPSSLFAREKAANPVPNHPDIDIMLTHGPPMGILDKTFRDKQHVGCDHLRKAVERCKPRIHCFGHIHEGWGVERMDWETKKATRLEIPWEKVVEGRSAFVDLSNGSVEPLKWGQETLFVNASIMNVHYNPENAPWVVDLELPMKNEERG